MTSYSIVITCCMCVGGSSAGCASGTRSSAAARASRRFGRRRAKGPHPVAPPEARGTAPHAGALNPSARSAGASQFGEAVPIVSEWAAPVSEWTAPSGSTTLLTAPPHIAVLNNACCPLAGGHLAASGCRGRRVSWRRRWSTEERGAAQGASSAAQAR